MDRKVYHEAYLGEYRIISLTGDSWAQQPAERFYVFRGPVQLAYATTLAEAEAQAQQAANERAAYREHLAAALAKQDADWPPAGA